MRRSSPGARAREVREALLGLLAEGRAEGAFEAASAAIWHDGAPLILATAGLDPAPGEPPSHRRRFDLASLTKPLATGLVAMREVSSGRLRLDTPLFADLPSHLTARALLSHRAGLPPFRPFAEALPRGFSPGSARTRYAMGAMTRLEAVSSAPPEAPIYSDIGFLLLAEALEALTGRPLRREVPGFLPGVRGARAPRDPRPFVPCGPCPLRGRLLRGEVHDPQAYALGGAAGHAGLFGTAAEVARLGAALVERAEGRPANRRLGPIAAEVIREFWAAESVRTPGSWRLGWDSPTPGASSAGTTYAPDAVGHLGFTGTSLWIEPSRRLVMVLLSNRVALGPPAQSVIRRFRPRFHDAVRAVLGLGVS